MTDKNKYITAAKELLKRTGAQKLTFEVISNSMAPLIKKGDTAVCESVSDIKLYDIVAFSSPRSEIPTLHRVIKITENGFVTKGDANPHKDVALLLAQNVIGRLRRIVKPKTVIDLNSTKGKILSRASIIINRVKNINFSKLFLPEKFKEDKNLIFVTQHENTPFEVWHRAINLNNALIKSLKFENVLDLSFGFSEEALNLQRAKFNVKRETGIADLILCMRAINVVKGGEREKLYGLIAENCPAGGRVLISYDNHGAPDIFKKVKRIFSAAGFADIIFNGVYVKQALKPKKLIKDLAAYNFKCEKVLTEGAIVSALFIKL